MFPCSLYADERYSRGSTQLQRPRCHICRRRRFVLPAIDVQARKAHQFSNSEIVAPIEREIRLLANGLTAVKDEQEYIVVRERTHRNTAESTNSRVKWWSIMQTLVLFSVVAWQIYYLKVRLHTACLYGRSLLIGDPVFLRSKKGNIGVLLACMPGVDALNIMDSSEYLCFSFWAAGRVIMHRLHSWNQWICAFPETALFVRLRR